MEVGPNKQPEKERRRARDPHVKKSEDYKHQRSSSEGGAGWRKARRQLPRMERRLYRHAQDRALREALQDPDDGELSVSDDVSGLKRKHFRLLRSRREIALGKKVALRNGGVRRLQYWVPAGRKQGRKYRPFWTFVKRDIEKHGRADEPGQDLK